MGDHTHFLWIWLWIIASCFLCRAQGLSKEASGTKPWTVPSHLSAEKSSDEEWARAGLANEESLTSLAKTTSGEETPASEIPFLRLLGRGLYLILLFWPVAWSSVLAYFSPWFRHTVWYKLLCWAI